MRAMVVPMLGGPEVLVLRDIPEPEPGIGEVAIRVAYAGVNYADVMARRGDHGHTASQFPITLGLEVSGHIHAVGEGVPNLHVGQPVAALAIGGYAEFALARAALTIPLSGDGVDLATAAALPLALPTAYAVLAEVARLRRGESVLIHAAAGGVGSLAGQIARHLGAGLVLGTVGSPDKISYAERFGYDHVFLRDTFSAGVRRVTDGAGMDSIVESIGGQVRTESFAALAPLGRLIVIGNATESIDAPLNPADLLFANTAVMGFSIGGLSRRNPERLATIMQEAVALVTSGVVRVEIAETLPLERAAEAHRHLEGRTSTGKIVLRVAA
jgi:NADPH2:quinone reductase